MKTLTKTMIAAIGALLITAAPAIANAERVYFLVGTRHVYRVGADQYAHVEEREKIEQDYADQVAADNDQFNKAVAEGADPEKETPDLNNALDELAQDRDRQLGALYASDDEERDRHPELRIDGDGPYQVIGVNMHRHGDVQVYDDFVVYAPWPGYVVVDPPYGWVYGVVYSPFAFVDLYLGWHAHFVAIGCPAFVGFYGHHGAIVVDGFSRGPRGELIRGGRGGFGRGTYGGSRYSRGVGGSRYSSGRTTSSYGRTGGTSRYGSGRTTSSYGRTGSTSRYGTSHTTSSYGRTGSTSRYSSGRTTSSYGRTGSTSRYGTSRTSSGTTSTRSTSRYGSGRTSPNSGSGRATSGTGSTRSSSTYGSGRSNSNSNAGRTNSTRTNPSSGGSRGNAGTNPGRSSAPQSFGIGRSSSPNSGSSRGSAPSVGSGRGSSPVSSGGGRGSAPSSPAPRKGGRG